MSHPIFARIYARTSVAEVRNQEPYRRELLAGLSGRVLEVGCGNGMNFVYYPREVSEVVGVEPEDYLLRQARLAAAKAARRIVLVRGRAEMVSQVVSGPFDAAVFSLMLCSVPDPQAVLREAKKVLEDGASVRFYEHVLSSDPKLARYQQLFAPAWSRAAGGCRPDRDTLSVLEKEFSISNVRTFDFCPGCRIPRGIVAPHVLADAVFHAS
jgi:ubiquinone/menaquinone biosynthesis C-methylase UbiE